MPNDLNRSIASATKWSVLAELFSKIAPPIVNMVLARLLVPEAFGIVASIAIITSFADIFTDAGFQKYIIQHEYEDETHLNLSLNVAFTSNFCLSAVIYALIVVFSAPLARLVGCPGEQRGISVASLAVIFTAFSGILLAKLKRDFDFRSVFYVRVLSALVPLLVTIPLAFHLRSYWAVIIGTLCQQAFIAVLALAISSWKPRFVFNYQEFRSMLSFSLWNLCETLSIWFAGQASVFIVANVLNAHYLGLYKTATATINSYMAIITASIAPVLFSALSRYQNHEGQFQSTFFKFQTMLALVVAPMGAGIFMYRELALSILLGKQWQEVTLLLGLWALASAVTIVFSNSACEVYRSKGVPKVSFLLQIAYLLFFIPGIYYSAKAGFAVLTYVSCGIRLLPVLMDLTVLHYRFGIKIGAVLKNTAWPFVSTAVMCICAFLFKTISDNVVWQIISILFCMGVYILTVSANKDCRELLRSLPIVTKAKTYLSTERKNTES